MMMQLPTAECLSELRLHELLAGELSGDEHDATDAHLGGCGACRARLSELEADRDAYRAAMPALPRRARPRVWMGAGAGVLAAAALLVFLWRPVTPPDGERTKGAARLGLFVRHDGATRAAAAGERVHAGDTLIFTVSQARATHVAILSKDGAGQASVYFPTGAVAERVEAGRDVELPLATVLDATLGPEELVALFCDGPLPLEPLRRALAGGDLAVPPGCALDRTTVEKVR